LSGVHPSASTSLCCTGPSRQTSPPTWNPYRASQPRGAGCHLIPALLSGADRLPPPFRQTSYELRVRCPPWCAAVVTPLLFSLSSTATISPSWSLPLIAFSLLAQVRRRARAPLPCRQAQSQAAAVQSRSRPVAGESTVSRAVRSQLSARPASHFACSRAHRLQSCRGPVS
jgi:hypothetical protein